MITLENCRIVSVRADLVKNDVKITIGVTLSPEVQQAARMKLGWWSVSEVPIGVAMTEAQEMLPGLEPDEPEPEEAENGQ